MTGSVLFTAVLLALAAATVSANVSAALKKCAEDNNLDLDTLQTACDGGQVDATKLRSYKDYTQCVQQIVGIMQANGTIDPKQAAALVDEPEQATMRDIAGQCINDTIADLGDRAYWVDQCYKSKNMTMYVKNCNNLLVVSGLKKN